MTTKPNRKSGLPRYCCWNLDRVNGRRRVRFRKAGFSTYISGTPWSDDFMRQYAACLDGAKPQPPAIGAARTVPGSINALIVSYYNLVFPTLKPSTQAHRRAILERFRHDHGDKSVARIERQHVASIIAKKANTPHAANSLLKILRLLFTHAIAINMRRDNPAAGLKKIKTSSDGIHTWTEDEVGQFITRHSLGSKPYLALMLMLWTGQRRGDIIRMGWQHIRVQTH
jgi:hypothetical protein